MAGLYTLRLTNDSPLGGNMCLYQRHPSQETEPDLLSLAWMCQPCRPGATATFSWNLDFAFTLSETGPFMPGTFFEPGQSLEVDPNAAGKRSLLLHHQDSGYSLEYGGAEPEAGYLSIQTDGSVPRNQAAVGLTVSGLPAFARPAGPNLSLIFQPDPQYWVAFGPFEPGQALDFSEMVLTTEIKFPSGKRSAQAAFQRDCTWTAR